MADDCTLNRQCQPFPAAGSTMLPAERRLHGPRGRCARSTTRRRHAQPRAVAALLLLPDAAGDRRAGRDLALSVLLARLHEPAQCRARRRPGDVFVGLKNFARLVRDEKFIDGWLLLLKYSAMCMTSEVLLGVLLAVILNRLALREDPGHHLPDADDDGAGDCRPGLVLSLQLDLRLVPLADAECGHPRRDLDPGLGRHGHVGHRPGRHLAMDAADHADRPGRAEAGAARPARGAHGRRCRRAAQLRVDHPAQPLPVPADRASCCGSWTISASSTRS